MSRPINQQPSPCRLARQETKFEVKIGPGSDPLRRRLTLERRPLAARRFAGVNEVVTMTRKFGARIIDPTWHVANRFRHVAGPFRTIVPPDSVRNHAKSCTIMHLWAVVHVHSVEKAKILHLWRLAHGVSVKCHASWHGGSRGRVVSPLITMIYGGC